MATALPVLEQVRVASPCSASWATMEGDEQVRFCQQCKLNVYDLSAMTREEAERLIREREGRLCGRLYRRKDGTVLTRDCPVGLAAVRRKLAGVVAKVAAVVVVTGGFFGLSRGANQRPGTDSVTQIEPFATIQRWLDPAGPPLGGVVMGEICVFPAQNNNGSSSSK